MSLIDHYAVFGHPIGHSLSPRIHALFAEQIGHPHFSYTAQDVPAEAFDVAIDTFFSVGGKGVNCTIPLKELAFARATETTERARMSRAVNTLIAKPDGTLLGDNTDGIGLLRDLEQNHQLNLQDKSILILGAGGATRGILGPLLDRNTTITIANRTEAKAQTLADEFATKGKVLSSALTSIPMAQYDLIINATPASLSGELPPLPEELITDKTACYDLAYAAEPTPFVKLGQQRNAQISIDGLGMLVEQAAEAFRLWRGVTPKTGPIIDRISEELGRSS